MQSMGNKLKTSTEWEVFVKNALIRFANYVHTNE